MITVQTNIRLSKTIRDAYQAMGDANDRPAAYYMKKALEAFIQSPVKSAKAKVKPVASFDLVAQADGTATDRDAVFRHWLTRMNKGQNTKLTQERSKLIAARIRDGYSVDDMIRAIDGCAASAFNMGQNDNGTLYNDITLIFRSGSKLEHFRDSSAVVKNTQSHQVHTKSQDRFNSIMNTELD